MIKNCGLDDVMIEFENKLLDGQKTVQWSKSDLKLLPKSGNLSNSENYRGKALTAAVVKFVIITKQNSSLNWKELCNWSDVLFIFFAVKLYYVLRMAIVGKEKKLSFKLDCRKDRRHEPVILN